MVMLRISKLTDYAILMMVELTRTREVLSAHALAERVRVEVPTASKVLKLIAQGYSNREIGEQLCLSERTVGKYASNILDKLHLANRTQVALYALRTGIASLEPE